MPRLLFWWLPALVLAAIAGIMPDTFLDNPYSTIPHEAAFLLRFWIIIAAFGYIALALGVRGVLYLGKQMASGTRRGFPVVTQNPARESAG